VDEAIGMILQMIESGCDPDTVTRNTLIDILYKADKTDKAWEMFHKMQQMNLSPTLIIYSSSRPMWISLRRHDLCKVVARKTLKLQAKGPNRQPSSILVPKLKHGTPSDSGHLKSGMPPE